MLHKIWDEPLTLTFFRGKRKKLFFVRSYLPSIVSESKPIPLWKTNMCLKAKKGLDLSKIVYWITEKWMVQPTCSLFVHCQTKRVISHQFGNKTTVFALRMFRHILIWSSNSIYGCFARGFSLFWLLTFNFVRHSLILVENTFTPQEKHGWHFSKN